MDLKRAKEYAAKPEVHAAFKDYSTWRKTTFSPPAPSNEVRASWNAGPGAKVGGMRFRADSYATTEADEAIADEVNAFALANLAGTNIAGSAFSAVALTRYVRGQHDQAQAAAVNTLLFCDLGNAEMADAGGTFWDGDALTAFAVLLNLGIDPLAAIGVTS